MSLSPSSRMTPWVGRLIIANAVVLLLLMTVFTSPALLEDLRFAPVRRADQRPWTFVSYMFVHAGLLHLLGNMLMLFVFGAPVESRMGSRKFILYYLYCGIGAAVFSVGLSGVMIGRAVHRRIRRGPGRGHRLCAVLARRRAGGVPGPDPDQGADLRRGHRRARRARRALLQRRDRPHRPRRRSALRLRLLPDPGALAPEPAPTAARSRAGRDGAVGRAPSRSIAPLRLRFGISADASADPVAAEVDRVLDKISPKGIGSLTPAERRFLDEVAKQKKDGRDA